ncbi:MAG TPA: tetratricopeptide repeat protein [Candidatus Cloacimonas sp.]|nr:tetratricopeptide repeat protein [Candidatus Cloacimonas sp.]HPS60369.1 tetratricopeptide repeat protein [Candidatus Cloacimonas sp.]
MKPYSKLLPGIVEWTLQQGKDEKVSAGFGCGYLFLDVCGFTKLTESASAKGHYGVEIITNLLNQYFDLLNEKIMQFGGQIIKFEGDAVLAAFPCAEETCFCQMQDCLQAFNRELQELNLRLKDKYGSNLAYHSSMGYGISQVIILGKPNWHQDYFVYSPVMVPLYTVFEEAGSNECLAVEYVPEQNLAANLKPEEIPQQAELVYEADFFPPEITQRIASVSFSGELRNAAILFIGVEAAKYIRQGDYETINSYYCAVQDIVYRLEGMINKIDYTDKGLILLISFGILQTHIDDIERAIICANLINNIESPLKAKIGLTYSNLYAGVLGGKRRGEYGIIGNGVNVAARLMTAAEYGQIVFTEDILFSAQSRFEVQFLRKETVKGIKEELSFYRIVRELPEFLNSYQRQYQDKEQVSYQAVTADIIKKIEEKKINQVLIAGEHGTGKSFLSWQILSRFYAADQKIAILVLDEFNRHDPLILHRKFISNAMELSDPLAEPEKLKAYIRETLEERDAEILFSALGLQNQSTAITDDSGKKIDLLLSSLQNSLNRLMQNYDLVLLDNIQWLDDLSVQILQKRLEEESIKPQTLILTTTEMPAVYQAKANAKTVFLQLQNLTQDEVFMLIRSQIPNITFQALDYLYNLAGGNPRFIIELCAQILSHFSDPDMLITESNIREIQNKGLLPYSVENLFMIKYESLSREAKEILKKASIIGKGFTLNEIFETHSGISQSEIMPVISELQNNEIIDITTLSPEVQYLFNNALMRQAVYSTILLGEKVSLHNRIASFYEEKYGTLAIRHSELLAYHYHLGENAEKALYYAMLAANQNQKISNHSEAIYYYQIALQHSTDLAEKIDIVLSIVDSQLYLGDVDVAKENLDTINPADISDWELLNKYHFLRCRIYYLNGDYESVLNYLKNVTDFTGKYGEQINVYQLDCLYRLYRIEEFSALLKNLEREFQKQAANTLQIKAKNPSLATLLSRYQQISEEQITEEQKRYLYLLLKLEAISANHLLNTGHYQNALKSLLFQYDLAKALKDDLSLRIASSGLGIVHTRMGNLDAAHKAYVEAINIADKINDRFGFAKVLSDMATLNRRMGKHQEALDHFHRSLKIFESLGNLVFQSVVLHGIGDVYLQDANYPEALKYFRKALKIARQCKDLFGISFEQDSIGDILFSTGKIDEAKALYIKNLKLQKKIGDNEGIAHTYGNLGNVARKENNLPLAIEYYTQNIQLTSEVGDKEGTGKGYFNLALIYEDLNEKEKVVELLNKALKCFQQAGSANLIQLTAKHLQEVLQGKEEEESKK